MKLKIELNINDPKNTWSILSGGKLKVIINHYLYQLEQSLKKHLDITMKSTWYDIPDYTINYCETCEFKDDPKCLDLNLECDDIRIKNSPECISYKPTDKYRQSLTTQTLAEFKNQLKNEEF